MICKDEVKVTSESKSLLLKCLNHYMLKCFPVFKGNFWNKMNTIGLAQWFMNIAFLIQGLDSSYYLELLAGGVSFEQVKDVMKDIMSDLQQTNSEKILLSWVRQSTRPYSQVNVLNFTTSWTDGLAFNAVLHRHKWDVTLLSCADLYKSVHPFCLSLLNPS